ncbi:hypothetical protein EMGBS15_14770 [Filimonas sp.]|jgi:hypothetical protein|nr:hypothetical protein EMGBS15_14770 [Filimonas sp.]
MKKYLLYLFLCISYHSRCQTLEEVNFSPTTATPWNTYTTGINNKGFICGYYENAAYSNNYPKTFYDTNRINAIITLAGRHT